MGGVAAAKKTVARAYLVTDRDFLPRFTACVCVIVAALAIGSQVDYCVETLDAVSNRMTFSLIRAATSLNWWALLGLLSSSCCALQLLLGLLSFGCAGFNTVLGPLRPGFLALSAVLQCCMWAGVYQRPFQFRGAATATAITIALSFLPEALDASLRLRSRRGGCEGEVRGHRSAVGSTAAATTLIFRLEGLGCIACVKTVTGALERNSAVIASRVSLEDGTVSVDVSVTAADALGKLKASLADDLTAVGFPATSKNEAPACRATGSEATEPVAIKTTASMTSGLIPVDTLSSVAAGLASSSCCLLQLALNALSSLNILHVGCAGFNKVLGPLRPLLRAVTGAAIVVMWTLFFLRQRRSRPQRLPASSGARASDDDVSAKSGGQVQRRVGGRTSDGGNGGGAGRWRRGRRLALNTGIALVLMFLPEMLKLGGGPAIAPPTSGARTLDLTVDGMGCEACETHVRGVLEASGGVIASTVNFETGQVKLVVAADWGLDIEAITTKLAVDGYEAKVVATQTANDHGVGALGHDGTSAVPESAGATAHTASR